MQNDPIKKLNRLVGWVAVVAGLLSILFVGLTIFGYGTLRVVVPANTSISINGHEFTGSSIRLQSGRYNIVLTSPYYSLSNDMVSVLPFTTKTYSPTLKPRDTSSILSSTIVTDGGRGRPQFSQQQWFENNTWIAGQLKLTGQFIALNYVNDRWQVAYYLGASGYPTNLTSVPADIASYITTREAVYATQPD